MGTDGLWDVTSNERVAEVVQRSLEQFPPEDASRYRYRFTSAAQDLVMSSRGKMAERSWRTSDNKSATIDDISVFVVPLAQYKEDFLRWKHEQEARQSGDNEASDGHTTVETSSYVSFANQLSPDHKEVDVSTDSHVLEEELPASESHPEQAAPSLDETEDKQQEEPQNEGNDSFDVDSHSLSEAQDDVDSSTS